MKICGTMVIRHDVNEHSFTTLTPRSNCDDTVRKLKVIQFEKIHCGIL